MADYNSLSVHDLHFSYGNTQVLEQISFQVRRGEFLCILGKSGCGKTTLLQLLCGLMKPRSGRICLEGRDITDAPAKERNMGFVFQSLALFEHMTVLANIEYALKVKAATRDTARETSLALIESFGLQDHLRKKPHQLSGGQRQKVAIARTLAVRPEIILFDEPLSSLDADTRTFMRGVIKQVQTEFGCTCIYVTHDQEEAVSLADRIMVMRDGRVEQIGPPQELLSRPATEYVKAFFSDNLRQRAAELSAFLGDFS